MVLFYRGKINTSSIEDKEKIKNGKEKPGFCSRAFNVEVVYYEV